MVGGVDVPDGCHCRLCVRGVLCHVVPADASSAIGDCERVLWTIFFGLAKTAQYTALAILGTSGYQRLKRIFVRR